MKALQIALPRWIRAALLATVCCIVAGAGLIAYRFYTRPTTLTLAVGAADGEARQTVALIAGRLAATDSRIRLKVDSAGNVRDAATAFGVGHVDLAVVRADLVDRQQARAVAVMAHGVAMIVAPPGSTITSIARLRGHSVGVVDGEINHGIVEALKKQYDLGHAGVEFTDLAAPDARHALQSKQVAALLLVMPLTEKNLAYVKALFSEGANAPPVLIPIDSAGAIADSQGPYESFDIPKGTLRGAPPVPDDDVTTLRVAYYLVANRHLDSALVGELAKKVMAARRDPAAGEPLLAGIAAPATDPDAYITVHPGAAAFYNGTQESFMDRYGNAIYLTPMVLGAMASIFAAAWRFLGVHPVDTTHSMLDAFYVLPGRIRKAVSEAELRAIEDDVDALLRAQLAKSAVHEESASDASALIAAAHRIDNLIHHRRMSLAARSSVKA